MIGSAELPTAFAAFERSFSAVNAMMSAQFVDAVESLFAVRVRATKRSILVIGIRLDLVLRQIDCKTRRLFLDARLSLLQSNVAARQRASQV